ncbi:hypothetical protein QR680_011594 [Steinernema hermaphroditum]|uniref:Phosphatidylinositol transfer protein N-terminal domain-containing protein n=1 Tax=Steinernema hermaphroditum TaxID=289476 RepID=A0AA39LZ77_9BILA|nr:hypothetical protein QR680_011594 [Steinernema hermaphroditum]
MLIKEYRVLVPVEVDEYRRGQLFAVAEASKAETGGGEGVEVLKSEPFTSSDLRPGEELSGIYTKKIYHVKSKVPWIVRKMFPESALILEEECWNAYPYSKTVVTVAGELYVRTLPKTLNFDGKVTMTKTPKKSVKECIHEWYSKPIHGVNFDENIKVCYGLEKIYKTEPSKLNRISYLLNGESDDVCTNNLTAAVNEAINKSGCRDGWYQLTFGAETYCYYSMSPEEYNQTADTSSAAYRSTIVPACKKLYPFSNAASIHSLNESEALSINN